MNLIDPVQLVAMAWPDVNLYSKQKEILYSVRDNDETVVPAGNGLGKDFIAALAVIWFMCSRRPARVVTTSVSESQLNDVLWGEIRNFLRTARVNLPLHEVHMKIRQVDNNGRFVPKSEVVGQVAKQGESLLGRHLPNDIPRTMAVFDEASGIPDTAYDTSDTWAHRKLIIGNPYPTTNFFFKGVREGDLWAPDNSRMYRKVIQIKATDSPNVRLGLAQERRGTQPTDETLIPGLVTYGTYKKRRQLWDAKKQSIGLDAEFYEGADVKMFPPDWITAAEVAAASLSLPRRQAKVIGCDPAEGGDNTCWAIADEFGLIDLISMKTPDTTVIADKTIELIREYGVPAKMVFFDRGGGGKQHADLLRRKGYAVNTVAFGASATLDAKRGIKTFAERSEESEDRTIFRNKRAEMYWLLRQAINPALRQAFGLPARFPDLREQLSKFPLVYDGEGILYLPPKNKRDPNSKVVTLVELIGRSPDEADAVALAVYGLYRKKTRATAGAAI